MPEPPLHLRLGVKAPARLAVAKGMFWRRDVICGTAALIVPFVVYVFSLMPSVSFWDTGEMQTVPYIFGVAHPTGFPSFVIIAGIFAHLFAIGNVAWRINLFAAIAMAIAMWALWYSAVQLRVPPLLALGAACWFAFGSVVWFHATHADIHDLALCFEALAFACALRWRELGKQNSFVFAALFLGLALATHPIALWMIPGLVLLASTGKARPPLALIGRAATAFVLPLFAYAYMPIRSFFVYRGRLDPTLALGLPPGQPFWDYAHTVNPPDFWWFIRGAQFKPNASLLASFSPHFDLIAFAGFAHFVLGEALAIGSAVLAIAVLLCLRRDWLLTLAILLAGLLVVPFTFAYTIEADWQRYLLFAMWSLTLLLAYGLSSLRRGMTYVTIGVTLLAAGHLWANRGIFAEARDFAGPQYVARVVANTPANAIILAPWVYATPLAYTAYVTDDFGRRTLVTASAATLAPYLPGWKLHRPVYEIIDGKPPKIVRL